MPPSELARFPERIDVRTPAEFAEDHVPGAINCPVLTNEQRVEVGTLHAQSPFEAKKLGAALISRNIATIVERFADRPREWTPLIYCWRGGQRSRSLAHVMNEIGWRAVQLEGGYRAYRRHVVDELARVPQRLRYRVVCGLTGSGKSRLIEALAAEGAQAIDLEGLARHRGSLLGDLPDDPQPSQKRFESLVLDALQRFDPARTVFVESESKRIGRLQVPDALLARMRASECARVDLDRGARVALLKEEYRHFLADPALLGQRLAPLLPLLGRELLDRWGALAAAGDFDTLVGELLDRHYDPMYTRSIRGNFPAIDRAITVAPRGIDADAYRAAARKLIADVATSEALP
ncbi:MAG TPA: tRNA 2-selenouridine(34) synthase MnmH [Casimicrobiaceae bacterium]|nr:tRNA 2-selenouridine(34) synthase MnmH [Casimicrobiaceae bacterium]